MTPLDAAHRLPVRAAFGRGWATLLLFIVVAIPLIITSGAIATALSDWTGGDITKSVSVIVWIPVVLIITGALLGRKTAPAQRPGLVGAAAGLRPRFGIVGITVVFAFAGANALAATGLPKQMTALLNRMNLPLWLLAILIGLIVIAVAAPLSATATMAAVGTVGVATLVAAGVPATTAAVAVLVFSSCEAAVPPGRRSAVRRLRHRGRGPDQDLRPPAYPLRPAAAGHRRPDHPRHPADLKEHRHAQDPTSHRSHLRPDPGSPPPGRSRCSWHGQAVALIAGQGDWLEFFNEAIKTPMCIAASVCAIAGFLLSYKRQQNK